MQALWMVLAALLFATMGVCVKVASVWFSSAELVFYRG
ncbi:MAG: EamA/RhaT family transporter, partial [Variovorax sp.]